MLRFAMILLLAVGLLAPPELFAQGSSYKRSSSSSTTRERSSSSTSRSWFENV